jgi:hypothetical protein
MIKDTMMGDGFGDSFTDGSCAGSSGNGGIGVGGDTTTGTPIITSHRGHTNVVPPRSSPRVSHVLHPGQMTTNAMRTKLNRLSVERKSFLSKSLGQNCPVCCVLLWSKNTSTVTHRLIKNKPTSRERESKSFVRE